MSASKGRTCAYEAMFVISQAEAQDLAGAVDHINEILGKSSAELIAMRKWDERRLAYEIEKQKRAVYILAYFSADPVSISGMERDCNLSERVMRFLITRVDHLTVEEMQASDGRRELADEAAMRKARAEAQRAEADEPAREAGVSA